MRTFLQRAKQSVFLFILVLTVAAAFASPVLSSTTKRGGRHPLLPTTCSRQQQQQQDVCQRRRYHHHQHATTRLHIALNFPRGGALEAAVTSASSTTTTSSLLQLSQLLGTWNSSPAAIFNTSLLVLALTTAVAKVLQRINNKSVDKKSDASDTTKTTKSTTTTTTTPPKAIQSLQRRFLAVFWLLRCSDWLQGPYFYEVYASKVFGPDAVQASIGLVSRLFLTGFASTALFGPAVGRAADQYGRKKATVAFSVIYALGALSTKSPLLMVLFAGRVLSGIGTSLLFSAPESWLVGEAQQSGQDPTGKYLGETFGLAYAGDSIVAILAGQIAALAASARGPTGPFEVSTAFLVMGGLLAAVLWEENTAKSSTTTTMTTTTNSKPSISDAIKVVRDDPRIMLVGAVQSLFEAAMYIFVLQWPPAMSSAIGQMFGETASATPYGAIFSCFMASCLLGSTVFGQLVKMKIRTESFTAAMSTVATIAMSTATWMASSLGRSTAATNVMWGFMASFFVFEACVVMYFRGIGTLRSKYVPDSHRSVIMNLFCDPIEMHWW